MKIFPFYLKLSPGSQELGNKLYMVCLTYWVTEEKNCQVATRYMLPLQGCPVGTATACDPSSALERCFYIAWLFLPWNPTEVIIIIQILQY